MQIKTLIKKIEQYKEIKNQQIELEMILEKLKKSFEKELLNNKVDEMIVDKYKISILEYDRDSFDSKLFKKDHSDLYNEYSSKKHVKSIVVK